MPCGVRNLGDRYVRIFLLFFCMFPFFWKYRDFFSRNGSAVLHFKTKTFVSIPYFSWLGTKTKGCCFSAVQIYALCKLTQFFWCLLREPLKLQRNWHNFSKRLGALNSEGKLIFFFFSKCCGPKVQDISDKKCTGKFLIRDSIYQIRKKTFAEENDIW